MKVKDAIVLMAKNPAVDFPWEGSLVTLVNSLLPEGSQLDPHTAEATEIVQALESLDASVKEMILGSTLGAVTIEIAPAHTSEQKITPKMQVKIFTAFGLLICVLAMAMVFKTGDGGTAQGAMEVFKLILQLILQLQTGG